MLFLYGHTYVVNKEVTIRFSSAAKKIRANEFFQDYTNPRAIFSFH